MLMYKHDDDEYSERKTNYTLAYNIRLRDIKAIDAMFANSDYIHLNVNMSEQAKREQQYLTFAHLCFDSHLKTEENTLEMLNYLVGKGLNLKHTVRDHRPSTPLHLAIEDNYLSSVQFLIDQKVDLNAIDHFFATPLSLATMHNFTDIALSLIKAGANVNTIDRQRNTPLYYALTHNNFSVASELIKHGADVNHLLENWKNFLCEEKILQHIDMVKLLIQSDIDVFHPMAGGNVLHVCAIHGFQEQWELFLNLCLNPHEKSNMAQTTFDILKNKSWGETFHAIYEKHCLNQKIDVNLKSSTKIKI